ncbi:MAG: anti-sigma factor antagonist [Deltaproteobacteria bacterium]|nr:anti-sigma factor antagonist [Deltaproteobacteria bacterium]
MEYRETGVVVRLSGRFDGVGAIRFDEWVAAQEADLSSVVLDMGQIEYLSSAGIRSLLKLEKMLRRKQGNMILAAVASFVSQTLSLSGLLDRLTMTATVEEGLDFIGKFIMGNAPETVVAGGRTYSLTVFPGAKSTVEQWGAALKPEGTHSDRFIMEKVSFAELGYAFGIGGLGNDAEQAAEATGEFLGLGHGVGIRPADGHCVADFFLTEKPAETVIHLTSAWGIAGSAALLLEGPKTGSLKLSDLLSDILAIGEQKKMGLLPAIGLIVLADTSEIDSGYYRDRSDISAGKKTKTPDRRGGALVMVGLTVLPSEEISATGMLAGDMVPEQQGALLPDGRRFHGHALILDAARPVFDTRNLPAALKKHLPLDQLRDVVDVGMETRLENISAWIYLPDSVRAGREKLLKVDVEGDPFPAEWETLVRRIYSDAGHVVMKPIHGGYSSKTYQVTSYDREGRRMLPTVLKIGGVDLTRREEDAFHEHVEKYILNNSTVIMGSAVEGAWAGLRYNFIGINGPDSQLTWLTRQYLERPLAELVPLFNRIFTDILRPWYGQPHWQVFSPYVAHHPLRNPLPVFSHILEDAERYLGVSPEAETITFEPLGMTLPNPYHFLKYGYDARRDVTCTWYTCITHGDLNMQNILLDERENVYIIDYSETGIRDAVTDFARLETILKTECLPLDDEAALKELVGFEEALLKVNALSDVPPWRYAGADPAAAEKAYGIIRLLRSYADRVTIFEKNMLPYLLSALEWTYPIVSYRSVNIWQKRFSMYSAALICRRILE